jgi:hypothetical protein
VLALYRCGLAMVACPRRRIAAGPRAFWWHRGGLSADLTTRHPGRDAFRVTMVKSEEALISEVQARLVTKFAEFPPDRVARAVAEAHARFEQSRVRNFVPLLVERRAGDDLFKQTQLVPYSASAPCYQGTAEAKSTPDGSGGLRSIRRVVRLTRRR